jgi:sugar lactone lactonase YvrE
MVVYSFAFTATAAKLALVAGGGDKEDNAPATEARLKEPFGVGFDRAGNLYIIEMAQGERLRKLDKSGLVSTSAGTGVKGFSGDGGPANKAQINGAHHIAIAPNDDIYIADTWNNCVRKIDVKTGIISTIVGNGQKGFSGDGGPAAKALSGGIYSIAFDAKAESLYLTDLDNRRIRAINLKSGIIQTVAGNGQKGVPPDGAEATKAPLFDPRAVAVDSKGNIYILERSGNALRVVGKDGKIRTVVNASGKKGAEGDGGEALQATMNGPKHLCVDRNDNVLIADAENHLIRKYLPKEGRIVRVAGNGQKGVAGLNGPPEQAQLNRPHGVYVHADGTLFITDSYNNRILKIAGETPKRADAGLIVLEEVSVQDAIQSLCRQAGLTFEVRQSVMESVQWQRKVSFRIEQATPEQALSALLANNGFVSQRDPADARHLRIVLAPEQKLQVVNIAAEMAKIPAPGDRVQLFEIKEVPLLDLLKILGRQAGFNLLFDPALATAILPHQRRPGSQTTASIRLENATAKQAMQQILETHGLAIIWDERSKMARITIQGK